MKIAICFEDFDPEVGGSNTYLMELLTAFAKMAAESKHEYVLMPGPVASDAIRQQLSAKNVVVSMYAQNRLSSLVAGLKYFSPAFRWACGWPGTVEREARKRDVQLLWYLGVGKYETPDIPYVATVLDLQHRIQPFFPEVSNRGAWDKREQYYGHFLRRAAYCVTGTEVGRKEIRFLYQIPESRIRVVPLPTPSFALDAASVEKDVRNLIGVEQEYVFYPAQFWAHKNHVNLILALKWLKEEKGVKLVLVMCGSDRGNLAYVQDFAKEQGLAEQMRYLGFVSVEDMVTLYRSALALTFVTYFGPDNIPPLEAFALSCPVIASDVSGAREQFGDAAILVDPSNPQAIAEAIFQLRLDGKLRATLVQAGRQRAIKWTAVDYIQKMFDLFDEFSIVRRNW